jgi:hypothetical protein
MMMTFKKLLWVLIPSILWIYSCKKSEEVVPVDGTNAELKNSFINDSRQLIVESGAELGVNAVFSQFEQGFYYYYDSELQKKLFGDSMKFMVSASVERGAVVDTFSAMYPGKTLNIRHYIKGDGRIQLGNLKTSPIPERGLPRVSLASISNQVSDFAACASGDLIWMGGGKDDSSNELSTILSINPQNGNITTSLADLPVSAGKSRASIATVSNKIIWLGGLNNNVPVNTVFEYNVSANAWNAKSNFPGTARSEAVVHNSNGFLFYGFGKNTSGQLLSDLWQYNAFSDTWEQLPAAPSQFKARSGFISFLLMNEFYVFGGTEANGNPLNDGWSINLQTRQWRQLKDMPLFMSNAGATVWNNLVYAVSGNCKSLSSEELGSAVMGYHPAKDAWFIVYDKDKTIFNNMVSPLSVTINNRLYMLERGGTTNPQLIEFY